MKYGEIKNQKTPIRANATTYGDYVICGSEDGAVQIWNRTSDFVPILNPHLFSSKKSNSNKSYESFSPIP